MCADMRKGVRLHVLCFLCLVSINSAIPEHYDDVNPFFIYCFLIELCRKLAAIPVYREWENKHSSSLTSLTN